MSDRAWVTYLSNTDYLMGCLVLAHSLRKVESKYPLVVMVPSSPPLASNDLEQLNKTSNIIVEPIDISIWQLRISPPSSPPTDGAQTGSDTKEYLWDYYAHTWAKLGAWGLFQYRRLVLLDCDMLVRINMDQLLNDRAVAGSTQLGIKNGSDDQENERKLQLGHNDAYLDLPDDWIAASHACTCNPMRNVRYPKAWTPDSCAYSQYDGNPCPPTHNVVPTASASAKNTAHLPTDAKVPPKRAYFNSGLVVLTPAQTHLDSILAVFRKVKSPDQYLFPDQDLLNEVFEGRWKSIGYGYNALKPLSFCHSRIWNEAPSIPSYNVDQAGEVMPVLNIHYILEKPWNVTDLVKAEQEKNRFVELYRWWWQAHDELRQATLASA